MILDAELTICAADGSPDFSALKTLMDRVDGQVIRYSETFADPLPLLTACAARDMEGIVSKRTDRPYQSGPSRYWLKTKCPQWREENRWRHEFFQRS